jgi:hypothetical protein
MAVMRVVPNPEEPQAGYGDIAEAPFPQGVPPANLPGSPPFQMPPLETRSGPAPSYAAGPPRPVTPPSGLPGPIYPGTWPGHAWRVGPAVHYTGNPMKFAGGQSPVMGYGALPTMSGDFGKFFKFGVVDNGLLILMTALGVGMDKWIAEKLKVSRGWGPIMGASVGNAISDGVAGLAEGTGPALGVSLGALLPVVPVFIASNVMKKSPEDKATQYLLLGSSAAMVLWAFLAKK